MGTKPQFLLGAAVAAWSVLAAAGAWEWRTQRREARRAVAALELKKQERDRLAGVSPAPSRENTAAITAEIETTEKMISALREMLAAAGAQSLPATSSTEPTDAYFELAAYVDRMRALAARAQVATRPEERFGFASYAAEGPAAPLVPAVLRQRVVLQPLVESLLESRPAALHGVRRQPPPGAAPPAGETAADFFEFDPRLSARVPGLVEGEAFRLEFSGRTAALREFLNRIATFKLPLLVRAVEVGPDEDDPPTAPEGGGSLLADRADAPLTAPLVRESLSRFTVIVELAAVSGVEASTPVR